MLNISEYLDEKLEWAVHWLLRLFPEFGYRLKEEKAPVADVRKVMMYRISEPPPPSSDVCGRY